MTRIMRRGKQQILLNYLPGKTFDFERIGTIAKVDSIRGIVRSDLNQHLIFGAIDDYVSAWSEEQRPALRNDIVGDPGRFVLLDPRDVHTNMFPLVFWCQNKGCGHVIDMSNSSPPQRPVCPVCRKGRLVQLRFVRIHRCGALLPLTPPRCKRCDSLNSMALDTRGSERIVNFRWKCLKCGTTYSVFGGRCRECSWITPIPGTSQPNNLDIEVHRAGRTFYPHYVVLLNQPGKELNNFLSIPEWPALAAATFLEFPEMHSRTLSEFGTFSKGSASQNPAVIGDREIEQLRSRGYTESQIKDFLQMQTQLQNTRSKEEEVSSPTGVANSLIQRTGVSGPVWQRAGHEMLEAILPLQSGTTHELFSPESVPMEGYSESRALAQNMGISRLTLVTDFPVTSATFGFSRVDYQPGLCRLNPFAPDRDHGGKFPVFIDVVQADALMLRLDAEQVCKWLDQNGYSPSLPKGAGNQGLIQKAYFVNLLDKAPFRETLRADRSCERMVFSLLHTLSHMAVRQAALLCGLDRTSLSEYILPGALTFAVYCNHRFGATIGALTSLFEQSMQEWLQSIRSNRICVYDPVCKDKGGNCHACTHLAETSCRFFNLNLGRSFLFGGPDPELGEIKVGYFDMSRGQKG